MSILNFENQKVLITLWQDLEVGYLIYLGFIFKLQGEEEINSYLIASVWVDSGFVFEIMPCFTTGETGI
jgi:hypothetical protein